MRFLRRNAIFIFFPAVLLAIFFLFRSSFGTAVSFGEWGERSIVESTLLLATEKMERVEQIISTTDKTLLRIVDPASIDTACRRWRRAVHAHPIVKLAAIIDDYGDTVALFHREASTAELSEMVATFERDIVPIIDKYDSLNQFKHLHQPIDDEYQLITHFTTHFEESDYTAVLVYDNRQIADELFEDLLGNVGAGLAANVVDDHHNIIFGRGIEAAGEFMVSLRFRSTLYKWRIQLAPTSAAYFASTARVKEFSQAMLIPLALGVIVFSLVILYMAVVRERRLNRLKSEFIANVSHELKTPLSLIRMFGELFVMGRVKEESRAHQYHQIILKETERLTSLIDNVLDFAKIERGKHAYNFEIKDVAGVVERVVELQRHRLEKMNIDLEFKAPERTPKIRIDEHAVTLAVANLIDNAAKYAQGTDAIHVEVKSRDGLIWIDVVDFGVGIPKHHLKRVFERFYRVPSRETRKQRGSGIGLSLVSHIARAHNGSVTVVSHPGRLTRFSLQIPVK